MPVISPDNYFVGLKDLKLLEVSGNDAKTFLQSQLTSDINSISEGETQYSSWCNPQGRIITTLLVHLIDNIYYLLVPTQLGESFIQQITRFILRSKVTISPVQPGVCITGISGSVLINNIKQHLKESENQNKFFILNLPEEHDKRVILISHEDIKTDIYNQFPELKNDSTSDYWKNEDIEAGFVWISESTNGKLLPQDLGLERLGALSFNKGCYPGQEIIARLHYRGKAKYGLYRGIAFDAPQVPKPGNSLYSQNNNTNIGMIVSVVSIGKNYIHCLVSINHEMAQSDSIFSVEKTWLLKMELSPI